MNILYHHRIGSRDGQAVHIDSLIAAFRRAEHQVRLVAPPSFGKVSFGRESSWLRLLRRLLPRICYEILETAYNVPVFLRLRRAVSESRPDIIYERYNLFVFAGAVLAWWCGIPLILEVNSPLAEERAKLGGLAFPRVAARIERRIWRSADFVLPVSRVLAERVRRAGVPAERIAVIPNGIDNDLLHPLDGFAAKKRLNLENKMVLGFVGFIRDWHGLDDILDLIRDPAAPETLHFLIVGDGPARRSLEDRAASLGLEDRLTFTGVVERGALAPYLAAFDIALQPKVVDYASPLKIFEYMAAGRAIAAPDQSNIREILTDGETAVLFRPEEFKALRDAILRLAGDAELRRRLGTAAYRTIFDRDYSWDANVRRIAALASNFAAQGPDRLGFKGSHHLSRDRLRS